MSRGPLPPARVAVRWDKSLRGRVVLAGPEQTEVLLDGAPARRTRVFISADLVRLVRRKSRSVRK